MPVMTGLSGNEMYCLHLKGLSPGELVVGNSVYSLGFVGGIGAGLKAAFGGEVTQITSVVHEGRQQSYARMLHEARATRRSGHLGRHQRTAAISREHRVPLGRLLPSRATKGRRPARCFPPAATDRSCTANSTPATCRSSSFSATWPIRSGSAGACSAG